MISLFPSTIHPFLISLVVSVDLSTMKDEEEEEEEKE